MWGFWIMAPQSAAALPGTLVADDDHAGGSEREGYRQLHKEGMGVMKGDGNIDQSQKTGTVAIW